MNKYEVLYIINDTIEEAAKKALIERFSGMVSENGGAVLKIDEWGRRRLAYPIRFMNEGYYVLMTFEAPAEAIGEFKRNFRITSDSVLRFMTTRIPDGTEISADEPEEVEEETAEVVEEAPAADAE